MKIIIADDSVISRRINVNLMKKAGFKDIIELSDGDEVIPCLEEHPDVKLILLDWNMERMSGLEALQILQNSPKYQKIPVVMITVEADKTKVIEAIQSGAKGYISKEFNPESFQARIQKIISDQGLEQDTKAEN